MNGALLSKRWFRISVLVLVVFLGILIGLPFLIQHQARLWLEDNGGDRVEIREVDFNPFTAELVLEGLLIEVEDRQPLHFDTARLELEWLPLLKKHIAVRSVELQGFYILIHNEELLRIGGIPVPPAPGQAATPQDTGQTSKWLAGINTLALRDFTLAYHDALIDQRIYIEDLELRGLRQWDPDTPARLKYQGAINDASVELDAEIAPFTRIPSYTGSLSIDRLSLTDFAPLARPALGNLDGLLSVSGDFEVEQMGDTIHILNDAELKIEEIGVRQEQIVLTNGSLAWQGVTDLTLNPASSQTRVRTEGKLTVDELAVEHTLANLNSEALAWDGVADVTLNTAAAQTSLKGQGRLTSAGLAADLQRQKLKFRYQDLDLDVKLSYRESESGPDLAVNSELLVSGLNVLAPEKKVNLISAEKLQLAGLQINGPSEISAQQITALDLDLGNSLAQQDKASDDDNRAILHAEQVVIGKFSHIDGFTAIDTLVEKDVQVVYRRNKEGEWNTVTLLAALAGEARDTESVDDKGAEQTREATQADAGPPPIAVNRVDVSKGSSATLIDESVTPAFKTTLTINELFLENLDGRKPDQTTTVRLDGRLDKHASVTAGGTIKPYLQPPEMDVQAQLAAIGLPPLSPYVTDSMGVIIDSGSLDVDLKLKSRDKRMQGEAVLSMHQLSLQDSGSKHGLQSKIPVPLDMALNILRDKNDTIELKIPIEGDAAAPDFDISDAITKAVAAGVSAGATSYLAYALQPYGTVLAVAKIAGEAASKIRLDPVRFAPGQSSLDDTARDYLSKIAKVLTERPKLAVKLCGIAVQQDVAQLQTASDTAREQSAKKNAAPAAPLVDKQKLTDLAGQRAASVRDHLAETFKVPASRLVDCQPRLETDRAGAIPRTELLL